VWQVFSAVKTSISAPRFTSKPPQGHHKNTTLKTRIFEKPPYKNAFSPWQKKLTTLSAAKCARLLSKAKGRRKLFYI
jgi:hypothetical protein